MAGDERVPVPLRLRRSTLSRLDALAERQDVSRSHLLRELIARGLALAEPAGPVRVVPSPASLTVAADPRERTVEGLRAVAAGAVQRARPRPAGPVWAGPVDADGYPMPEEGQ